MGVLLLLFCFSVFDTFFFCIIIFFKGEQLSKCEKIKLCPFYAYIYPFHVFSSHHFCWVFSFSFLHFLGGGVKIIFSSTSWCWWWWLSFGVSFTAHLFIKLTEDFRNGVEKCVYITILGFLFFSFCSDHFQVLKSIYASILTSHFIRYTLLVLP